MDKKADEVRKNRKGRGWGEGCWRGGEGEDGVAAEPGLGQGPPHHRAADAARQGQGEAQADGQEGRGGEGRSEGEGLG